MAGASLTDVTKKLDEVKSAVKAGEVATGTERASAAENAAEAARKAAYALTVQEGILKNTAFRKPDKDDGDGFGMMGIKLAALITAAGAGLVAGLTTGFIDFYKSIFKLAGKLTPKWLDDIFKKFKAPKWLDDFFKAFTKEGKLAKKVMKIIDNFKMPKVNFLDDVFKAFTKEGKLFKKITGIFDKFKMPKFTFITKITDFLKSTDKFKEISKAIDGVMDLLPKGKGGGTIGRMFAGIKDVFKPLTKIGDTLGAAFKPIKTLLGSGKEGSGILKSMGAFLKGGMIEQVFKAFAKVGKAIAAPLAIIMGIVDGFFESKDAISKSDGVMAKLVNGIVGAIGGFVDGAIFQVLDLVKSGVSLLAGFFGWTEVETFLDSFSFSEMFNKFLDKVYNWFNTLFKDPVAALTQLFAGFFGTALSVGDFIVDMLKKPLVWIMKLFGWDDAAAATEKFSFSGTIMGVFNKAVAWIKGIFADPVKGLTDTLAAIAGGYGSFLDFITAPLKKGIAWILRLFGWDEAAEKAETFSFKGTIMGVFDKAVAWVKSLFAWGKKAGETEEGGWSLVTFIDGVWLKVKEWVSALFSWGRENPKTSWLFTTIDTVIATVKGWVTGLFTWASEEDEKDSWIVKTIKGVVKTVKDWFGNMFKFDTGSEVLKSVLNIMMWIPNLLVKAMLGVTSFVAGLLGFDEKSKDLADAGKDFSFGDLIGDGLKALADWFRGLFDIDMSKLGRSILGDTLYGFLFGDTADAQIMAKKKEIEMHKKELKEGDTRTALGFSREGEIEDLEKQIAKLEKEKAVVKPAIDVAKVAETVTAPVEAIKKRPSKRERRKIKKSRLERMADQKPFWLEIQETLGLPTDAITQMAVYQNLQKMKREVGLESVAKLFAPDTLRAVGINLEALEKGGLVKSSGLAEVHKHELMLDNQAAAVFMKAAQLLTGSQVLEQSRMGGGGTVVVNNNNNVDNSMRSSQSTSVSVPEATRPNESTLRALQMA